jgi:hypothetical protein
MLNDKENYKIRKRLTKIIRRLILQNKGVNPQMLLNSWIQTQDDVKRFWVGFTGLVLVIVSCFLFLRLDWTILLSIVLMPLGILLMRDAWRGDKKRVRDYLRELADLPVDVPLTDIDNLVNKVFTDCGAKFKAGGGDFGGAGASGTWDGPAQVDTILEAPDLPSANGDIPLEISINDVPDVSEGAGEIAGGILESIFSSASV